MFDFFRSLVSFIGDHAAWLVINLGVPVLLPFVAIVVVSVASQKGSLRSLMRKSIEHGQLFWTVISLLAATVYDALVALDTHVDQKASVWWTVGICVFVGFVSTMFVGIATMHAAESRPTNGRTITVSVIATICMCVFYPFVHFKFL